MQFVMNRDALHHAAQVASKVASKAATREAACALVEARDGEVSFSATDGEQSVRHSDLAMVEDAGSCMVPAAALARIVKSLGDGAVTVSSNGAAVTIEGSGSRFELPGMDASLWQGMPSECEGPSCTVGAEALADMVKRAAPFAAGKADSREWSKGVHIVSDASSLALQATDSYRIVECVAECGGGEFDVTVPAQFLVSAVDAMFGDVEVRSDGNRCMLSCGSTSMSTRAIAARYPDISRMWPKAPKFELELDRDGMSRAVGRAAMLGSVPSVSIDARGGEMRISAADSGLGSFEESVPCEGAYSGCASIAFLKSCLDAMDVRDVRVQADGELAPITFIGGNVRASVMPIRRTA